MNLKIGGNNVGKIMYGGQEFGGANKLEPGTILYIVNPGSNKIENVHLLNTTKKWENINGITIQEFNPTTDFVSNSVDIVGDDLKNLDTEKQYILGSRSITVSRSIIDGEYRLNVLGIATTFRIAIKAI